MPEPLFLWPLEGKTSAEGCGIKIEGVLNG